MDGEYEGKDGDDVIVDGGENLKGEKENDEDGKWFENEGIEKRWSDDVYDFDGKEWKVEGKMKRGMEYGEELDEKGGIMVVGGEDREGKERKEVLIIKWDGKEI